MAHHTYTWWHYITPLGFRLYLNWNLQRFGLHQRWHTHNHLRLFKQRDPHCFRCTPTDTGLSFVLDPWFAQSPLCRVFHSSHYLFSSRYHHMMAVWSEYVHSTTSCVQVLVNYLVNHLFMMIIDISLWLLSFSTNQCSLCTSSRRLQLPIPTKGVSNENEFPIVHWFHFHTTPHCFCILIMSLF